MCKNVSLIYKNCMLLNILHHIAAFKLWSIQFDCYYNIWLSVKVMIRFWKQCGACASLTNQGLLNIGNKINKFLNKINKILLILIINLLILKWKKISIYHTVRTVPKSYRNIVDLIWFDLSCLTPLSAIFQLYHGDQFKWWKKPEYPERTTDHGQATGKLYRLRLWVECPLFVIYKAGREPPPYWW